MVHIQPIQPVSKKYLETLGFMWHTDNDESDYIANELVVVTQNEANTYYEAVNELYDMFIEAGEYIIQNNLFHEVGIPFNLIDIIKKSWDSDVHWHLYGRFDLAGGIDGKPIKLLEFNADTPTALFESSIIQWAILKYNNLDEASQFNGIYEALFDNFKRIVTLDEDISSFEERYEGWKFLFTSIRGNIEEENTVKLLQHIATQAGFVTEFAYIDEIEFEDDEGVFFNDEIYELWFKLIPWEDIALDEPDLAMILTHIIQNQKAIIFNPAYTLLFQNKAILKILWDLYPNHPLLLETSFEPLANKTQVIKPIYGREGASIKIVDSSYKVLEKDINDDYVNHKIIYQEFIELPSNELNEYYQAGVFFAYEACGLGFRKGGKILNNMSKFVAHIIKS